MLDGLFFLYDDMGMGTYRSGLRAMVSLLLLGLERIRLERGVLEFFLLACLLDTTHWRLTTSFSTLGSHILYAQFIYSTPLFSSRVLLPPPTRPCPLLHSPTSFGRLSPCRVMLLPSSI